MSKQLNPSDSKKDSSQVLLDFAIHFQDLIFSESDLLGQGGYGKVYKGEWQFNTVAIKQYTAQDFSETTKTEITKEAKIMATVSTQSDYLVRLKGVVLERPHYSLVMEYLPGGDLFHLLKSGEELSWTRRYRIGLDITIGLHHLHERSVLHRDLKSLNVLLDSNGRAKLADFGLSTLKTSSASTTVVGFKGTVLWSAPELFKRGAKATTAADIYSLAMVLWELASRQLPFADAATPAIAADWVRSGEQENVPEGTPEEFKALILAGWHKDPAVRPNASDMAKKLDTLWKAEKKKAPAISTPASTPTSASSVSQSGVSAPVLTIDPQSGQPLLLTVSPSVKESPAAAMASEQALEVQFGIPPKSDRPVIKASREDATQKLKSDGPLSDQWLSSVPAGLVSLTEENKKSSTMQDELVAACEQGDLSLVKLNIQKGAKPFEVNSSGKHPLGAAVWGMSPEVLNYLIKYDLLDEGGGKKILSWDEIERHNCKHYHEEIWLIPQFFVENFNHWQILVGKMDKNLFVRDLHLQHYNQQFKKNLDWQSFKKKIDQRDPKNLIPDAVKPFIMSLDKEYQNLKSATKTIVTGLKSAVPTKPTSSPHTIPAEEGIFGRDEDEDIFGRPEKIENFLGLVADGYQDEVERLIKKDARLLLTAGKLRDRAGREFKQITAFQYAVWALDWHMWTMIQNYLSTEIQTEQLVTLESKSTVHGRYFSLEPLMDALQMFLDYCQKWSFNKVNRHWCEVVGGLQKKLPMHIVNEYCRKDRGFKPCPTEWKSPLPRTQNVTLYYSEIPYTRNLSWFNSSFSATDINNRKEYALGRNFAFYKHGEEVCGTKLKMAYGGRSVSEDMVRIVESNIKALQSLWKTRMEQVELLRLQLFSKEQQKLLYQTASPIDPEKLYSSSAVMLLSQNPHSILSTSAATLNQRKVNQLLRLVVEGEQDKSEEFIKSELKESKNLLLTVGTVTDLSGREFKKITAFQYALWALDWHMWSMIQQYLPIKAQKQQFEQLELEGTMCGKHFSLKPLIDGLQEFGRIKEFKYGRLELSDRIVSCWDKITKAQKELPAHIVHEYCRKDRPFKPCPKEWESKLPRTQELKVYGQKDYESFWFELFSPKDVIGPDCAIVRDLLPNAQAVIALKTFENYDPFFDSAAADLRALHSLWKARIAQLKAVACQLKVNLAGDSIHEPVSDNNCRLM